MLVWTDIITMNIFPPCLGFMLDHKVHQNCPGMLWIHSGSKPTQTHSPFAVIVPFFDFFRILFFDIWSFYWIVSWHFPVWWWWWWYFYSNFCVCQLFKSHNSYFVWSILPSALCNIFSPSFWDFQFLFTNWVEYILSITWLGFNLCWIVSQKFTQIALTTFKCIVL